MEWRRVWTNKRREKRLKAHRIRSQTPRRNGEGPLTNVKNMVNCTIIAIKATTFGLSPLSIETLHSSHEIVCSLLFKRHPLLPLRSSGIRERSERRDERKREWDVLKGPGAWIPPQQRKEGQRCRIGSGRVGRVLKEKSP